MSQEPCYFIRPVGGAVQGPFEVSRIQQWVATGKVREEMDFSEDGKMWWSGRDWPGMFPNAVQATSPAATPPAGTPELVECPYCSEEIRSTAKKCKSCGEWLEMSRVPSPRPEPAQRRHFLALGAALFVVVGCFMPWVQMGAMIKNNGIDNPDGQVAIVLGLLALAVAAAESSGKGRNLRWPYLVLGLICLAIGVIDFIDIHERVVNNAPRNLGVLGELIKPSIGIGLYLVAAGGLGLLVAGFLADSGAVRRSDVRSRRHRSPRRRR